MGFFSKVDRKSTSEFDDERNASTAFGSNSLGPMAVAAWCERVLGNSRNECLTLRRQIAISSRDSKSASTHPGRKYRLHPRHWCIVRFVAMPSVISTCVLMHKTHMLVGFGGIGSEHMQHRIVGICFSGSGGGGAARPSVGATTSIFPVRKIDPHTNA